MAPSRRVWVALLSFVLLAAPRGAAQALYGEDSPIIPLDKKGWNDMQADLSHVWVVEFYADWCGHCKAFAPKFEKAATNLAGLVKFGGVNADSAKTLVKDAGVLSFPTVKIYLPELTTNPYTGKVGRVVLNYEGARSAKGVVDFVSAHFPNLVLPVGPADGSLERLVRDGAEHLNGAHEAAHAKRALLLSAKAETSLLAKALALRLKGRLALGEAKEQALSAADGGEQTLAERLGVSALPALVILAGSTPGSGGEPAVAVVEVYSGEMKAAPLFDFLESHAGPPPPRADASKEAGAKGRPLSDVLTGVDEAVYAAEIEGSSDVWVLAFEQNTTLDGADDAAEPARIPALPKLAAQLRGQAIVGLVNASTASGAAFAAKMGVTEFPALRVLPYGPEGKGADAAIAVSDAAAARKAAGESLPTSAVQLVGAAELDSLLAAAVQQADTMATCVLFSDKRSPPPLLRALALHFAGAFGFGMVPEASAEALARFQLQKVPTLLCLWAEAAASQDGQLALQGAKYDDEAGPLAFAPLGMFLANLAEQRGGADWAAKRDKAKAESEEGGGSAFRAGGGSGGAGAGAGSASGKQQAVTELTAANYEQLCGESAPVGLCAIALLDGDRSEAPSRARAEQLKTLAGLAVRRRGDPSVSLHWLDATCYDEFGPALDISDADLPTLVVLSPSKRRFARLRGTFTVEGMARFVAGVVSSRVATLPFERLPALDASVHCETALRGAAKAAALAGEEGDDDAADTIAEILAEERERERALQEELAQAAAHGGGADADADAATAEGTRRKGSGGGSAELQRLEAELEECSVHDLLCGARREKQLQAIEKRRQLEERLAEIAAKSKAKKKKKKKAASSN